jgi:putative toxin-antitoxin system antitoxin component (TIGR02293 family)
MSTTTPRKSSAKLRAPPSSPRKTMAKPAVTVGIPVPRLKASGHRFFKWSVKLAKSKASKRIEMIRRGAEPYLLFDASTHFKIPRAKLLNIVGVSVSTVERKVKAGVMLGARESDRLARIALIERETAEVFGSPESAKEWLLRKNIALGEAPLLLLDTETGADEVRKILSAIAYGGVA